MLAREKAPRQRGERAEGGDNGVGFVADLRRAADGVLAFETEGYEGRVDVRKTIVGWM